MQLVKLFEMQKALDNYIEEKHQLQKEDLFDRKVLALLVEIGELANETRCFKFWSIRPSSEREVILEEFVDGIHFILSLGIECDFHEKTVTLTTSSPVLTISEQFIQIYHVVGVFQRTRDLNDFISVFEHYLQLAALLGITFEEMEQAYIKKNEVNYKRQHSNY